jgi:hypothetical protein
MGGDQEKELLMTVVWQAAHACTTDVFSAAFSFFRYCRCSVAMPLVVVWVGLCVFVNVGEGTEGREEGGYSFGRGVCGAGSV